MKPAVLVAAAFLCLVSLAHLVRVLFQVEIVVAEATIPVWASLFAFLLVGSLAVWLWREGAAEPGRR